MSENEIMQALLFSNKSFSKNMNFGIYILNSFQKRQ